MPEVSPQLSEQIWKKGECHNKIASDVVRTALAVMVVALPTFLRTDSQRDTNLVVCAVPHRRHQDANMPGIGGLEEERGERRKTLHLIPITDITGVVTTKTAILQLELFLEIARRLVDSQR